MSSYYKNRAITLGRHIVKTKSTIRETAKLFGFSKSTVHNDVSNKLLKYDKRLYKKVQKVFKKNFMQKHIRGGEATRIKFLRQKG